MQNPEIRTTCVMTFLTSRENQHNVRVRDPRVGITVVNVSGAATTLIMANPFESEIGELERLVGAQLVTDTIYTIV